MRKGLTLIEIVIVVALIAILAGIYIVVANPAGQLASSRNSERQFHLQSIMEAVRQNISDQGNGQFSCAAGPIPTSSTRMASASGSYNIAPCISSILLVMPFDPSGSGAHYTSNSDYDSGYNIAISSSTGQITVSAPFAELGKTVSITR